MTNDMPELKPCPFTPQESLLRLADVCDRYTGKEYDVENIRSALTRADTPTSNRVGYEARCADCNRFLQSEETCSCSPTSAERKAEDRRRRHALMGMPDFHTHYQIHGKWAQAHHEAIRAALQQPDTSVAVRVLVHALQLDPDPPEYIGRKYREALRHPAVIAAMKGE